MLNYIIIVPNALCIYNILRTVSDYIFYSGSGVYVTVQKLIIMYITYTIRFCFVQSEIGSDEVGWSNIFYVWYNMVHA